MKKAICIILTLLLAASLVVTLAACSSAPTQEFASAEEWDNAWKNTENILSLDPNSENVCNYSVKVTSKRVFDDNNAATSEGQVTVDMKNLKVYLKVNESYKTSFYNETTYEEITTEMYLEVVDNVYYQYVKTGRSKVFSFIKWEAHKFEGTSKDDAWSDLCNQYVKLFIPNFNGGQKTFEDYELKGGYYELEENSTEHLGFTKLKFRNDKLTYLSYSVEYESDIFFMKSDAGTFEINYSGSVNIPSSLQALRDTALSH